MAQMRFKPTDVTFNQVADLYLAQLRQCANPPTVDIMVEAFPHLEAELREQLPSLTLLEQTLAPLVKEEVTLGSCLGGCELLRELGRGAMGIVYEAFDRQLGRKVAVKVIPLELGTSSMVVDRFELERHAMARVEHPNIVPVYSYGHDNRHAYLVMKLVEGHSLYELQAGGGDFRGKYLFNELYTDWSTLANLGADVAAGLQHSHDQGLVHRDIKPGNLLLDKEGKVWISDFGLAKVFDYARSLSRTGDVVGTPCYMAPEQLRGACDARADVYSLGLTLYELATGEKTWGEKSDLKLLIERNSVSLPNLQSIRPDIPDALSLIIMKACQFAPENRYQSAGEMGIVLGRFLAGSRPSDRRRKKREPDDVFRKKHTLYTLITTVSVTFLTFFVGVLFFIRPTEEISVPIPISMAADVAEVESPEFRESAFGLIDKLADENEDKMVDIVAGFLHESLNESSEGLHFSETAKGELQNQVDYIAKQIKTKGLTEEALDEFLEGYRKTPLPQATRVMRLTVLVSNSGMTKQEKEAGIELLRGLASAVINGAISERQADKIINELTRGRSGSTDQIALMRIPDQDLRRWLGNLYATIKKLPADQTGPARVPQAIRKNIQHSFGDN